jgi:hypothetical protein
LQALAQSGGYRSGERFAGFAGELAGQFVGFGGFNVKGLGSTW